MDTLHKLAQGFALAGNWTTLLCVLAGCLLGMLVVARSILGPAATMALLLPLAYALAPLPGLALLAGIGYGAHYGSSRAAMLGALGAASLATLLLALGGPWLGGLYLNWGPVERFTLLLMGLLLALALAAGPWLKALGMLLLGLLLGLVGKDAQSGLLRFTLDWAELDAGLGLAALAMGLLVTAEIVRSLGSEALPLLGLPRKPTACSGNALTQTACLPLLALGLPVTVPMALLLGDMAMQRVQIGAQLADNRPELFWGLLACLWLGNLMLVLLHLPLPGRLNQLSQRLRLPRFPLRWLYPALLLLGALALYSVSQRAFDLWLLTAFGLVGYVLQQLELAPGPLLLGLVLGPMLEDRLRQALAFSGGDWSVFATRPLSAGLLVCGLGLVLALPLLPRWSSRVWALLRR